VVESLDARAAAGVSLRLVAPRRLQVLGSDVSLGLVEELEPVAVGVLEPERGPVPDVAVDPAAAEAGLLDRRDTAFERLGAPGAEPDVTETGGLRLGQLQAVAQVVAPAAQVDRLPLARLLLHPEHVDEEAQALLRGRREQLGMPDPGDLVERNHFSTRPRRPSRS
jgi:hypothetical protein